MAHESFHAEEMYIIKFDEYVKDCTIGNLRFPDDYTDANLIRLYKREKYVFDRIIKNKKKFNLNDNESRHNFYNLDFYQYHLEERKIKIPK